MASLLAMRASSVAVSVWRHPQRHAKYHAVRLGLGGGD
jgi:hypothetical protein